MESKALACFFIFLVSTVAVQGSPNRQEQKVEKQERANVAKEERISTGGLPSCLFKLVTNLILKATLGGLGLDDVLTAIVDLVVCLLDAILELVASLLTNVQSILSGNITQDAVDTLLKQLCCLVDLLKQVICGICALVEQLTNLLAAPNLSSCLDSAAKQQITDFQTTLENVCKSLQDLLSQLQSILDDVQQAVNNANGDLSALLTALQTTLADLPSLLQSIQTCLTPQLIQLLQQLPGVLANALTCILGL